MNSYASENEYVLREAEESSLYLYESIRLLSQFACLPDHSSSQPAMFEWACAHVAVLYENEKNQLNTGGRNGGDGSGGSAGGCGTQPKKEKEKYYSSS